MKPENSNPNSSATPRNEDVGGAIFGERLARIEAGIEFMATREDIALARREVVDTKAEVGASIADVKAELRTSIADLKTLISEREPSMQRWLLGITARPWPALSSRWSEPSCSAPEQVPRSAASPPP